LIYEFKQSYRDGNYVVVNTPLSFPLKAWNICSLTKFDQRCTNDQQYFNVLQYIGAHDISVH